MKQENYLERSSNQIISYPRINSISYRRAYRWDEWATCRFGQTRCWSCYYKMRALLLAAGIGTRLRPLTDTTPKCLMEINGAPLLGRWLETLNSLGANEIVINTHYLPTMVNDFIASHPLKEIVRINHEHELLGTAGTLRRHSDFLSQNGGIVIHADNYCLANMGNFLQAELNRPKHCVMTMMIFITDDPQSCGIVETDELGIVTAFYEKVSEPPSLTANAAIYVLTPSFFKAVNLDCEKITRYKPRYYIVIDG